MEEAALPAALCLGSFRVSAGHSTGCFQDEAASLLPGAAPVRTAFPLAAAFSHKRFKSTLTRRASSGLQPVPSPLSVTSDGQRWFHAVLLLSPPGDEGDEDGPSVTKGRRPRWAMEANPCLSGPPQTFGSCMLTSLAPCFWLPRAAPLSLMVRVLLPAPTLHLFMDVGPPPCLGHPCARHALPLLSAVGILDVCLQAMFILLGNGWKTQELGIIL